MALIGGGGGLTDTGLGATSNESDGSAVGIRDETTLFFSLGGLDVFEDLSCPDALLLPDVLSRKA